jgi:hypothetical protein
MKTNIYISIICLTAVFSFLFVSCDKGDTIKPVIDLIEPEEGAALQIGNPNGVHLEMDLSDNEMLAAYKVDIHPNFDNHEHTRADNGTTDFYSVNSWVISGEKNTHIHHHEIKIPADATPGNYHFMVYCIDAAGNESHVARSIILGYDEEEEHDED